MRGIEPLGTLAIEHESTEGRAVDRGAIPACFVPDSNMPVSAQLSLVGGHDVRVYRHDYLS